MFHCLWLHRWEMLINTSLIPEATVTATAKLTLTQIAAMQAVRQSGSPQPPHQPSTPVRRPPRRSAGVPEEDSPRRLTENGGTGLAEIEVVHDSAREGGSKLGSPSRGGGEEHGERGDVESGGGGLDVVSRECGDALVVYRINQSIDDVLVLCVVVRRGVLSCAVLYCTFLGFARSWC